MAQLNKQTHLQCPNCNHVSSIIRVKGKDRKKEDHIKNLYCPNCKTTHKHREIPRIDHYNYDRISKNLIILNRYQDRRKEELRLIVNKTHWENWLDFERKAFDEELLITTDYTLFETLLLNYINEEDFQKEVNSMDAPKWTLQDPNATIMGVRVSKSVLENFKFVCDKANLSHTDVIYNILQFTRDGSFRLE